VSYPLVQTSSPPLDWPHYGVGFVDAIKRAYRKYATFPVAQAAGKPRKPKPND